MDKKDRPLSIAMFGHKRIPGREGGIEVVVEELCTRLVKRGHHVVCYNRRGHHVSGTQYDDKAIDSSSDDSDYKGVKLRNVWTLDRRGFAAMTSSFSAALKASRSECDIIHIHAEGPAAMCGLLHLLLRRRKGGKNGSGDNWTTGKKKIIVTIHGLDWQRAKWGKMASRYIKFGEKQAVKYADEIIVLSRGVQEYFSSTYNRDTVFIPNGVSLPTSRPSQRITEKWGLEKDSYVLFLGRIVPEKGLGYLIEAWKGIRTDKKLVITGGSSDTAGFMTELKEMAEGDGRIVFTGFQQGRVLEELYSNCYIYCLPSDLEGMPLSLLEAMSYGNCCVVSDISECTEVVEDKGVTFRKSDVEDLRSVLQGLLDAPERVAGYKGSASSFICQKYSWDDVVEKTLELYRE